MRCGDCGFESPPDFAFCPKCGSRLPSTCPSCGAPRSSEFAFCPRCGGRLAPAPEGGPALPGDRGGPVPREPQASRPSAKAEEAGGPDPEADRRLVTVLFADLSGFTTLSERLDPEEVRAFQGELFREMAAAVARYDGFVEKFVGDAVMAVFGAPVAHEDDPERALRAALAMHGRMGALNQRWERRLGRPLALHVGVNTGPVVAGTLGSVSGGAYAVTGDTVNVASRLQSAAPPGQTLVGLATHRLTAHVFAFEPLGEVAMKGKALSIAVYRMLGLRDAPASARGLEAHGLVAPLIGRADELEALRAAFARMEGGRAQVVSLVGEAGVGKSRLLRECLGGLEAAGRFEGMAVRRVTCSSLGEQPYAVVSAFFRGAYGIGPDDTLEAAREKLDAGLRALGADAEEVAHIAPLLGYVLGVESGDQLRHLDAGQLKRQIFLALRRLIEWRLRQGPLVLVVEDLHWADAASVELLQYVADRLADSRLLLVATSRPAFDARALMTTRATHTAIRLPPLSPGESGALLAAFFGPSVERLPARLRQLVVDRAGGHPFYLEEIVRGLMADGVLVREDSGWRCAADAATVDVPPTIQGLLLSRVDRLPPATRRVVQEAAVLGPEFEASLLRRVSSEPAACASALALLQESQLLEEATPTGGTPEPPTATRSRYRFTNTLVQEVVYQSLLVRRRLELHGRVGQALEAQVGEHPRRLEDIEALGHHFSLSEEKLKGVRYLLEAADWARGVYANDDAVRHYERGLATLGDDGAGEAERLAVRERLGDLLAPMGRREDALTHYGAVLARHRDGGDRAAQARLHRKIGGLHWEAGDRSRALADFQSGLALLEGETEHIELAHLYQEMGRLAFRSGDNPGAIHWAERALAHAERLAEAPPEAARALDPDARKESALAVSHAHNTLGVALARTGRLSDAVGHIEQSVAVAQAGELLQAACRGYTNLGVLYSTLDPKRAIETCLKGLETAKRIGDLGFQSRLQTNLAVAYCALTDRCEEQGIVAAQAAIELDRQLGQLDHLAVPLIVLGQIQQCHGQPQLAFRYFHEALALVEGIGEPQLLFPCYDGLATLHLDRGEEAEAEPYMLKAQQVCERAGLEPDSLLVLPFLE